MSRTPKPDLDPGDRVLVVAHRWQDTPWGGRGWWPCGGYRWRVVDAVVWDSMAERWWLDCSDPAPHHPSREQATEVVAVLRANGGERRPTPPAPVQLGLFEVAS